MWPHCQLGWPLSVETNYLWQCNRNYQTVWQIKGPTHLVSQRVRDPQEGIGKGQTSNRGAVMHLLAGQLVALDGCLKIFHNALDGFQRPATRVVSCHYGNV